MKVSKEEKQKGLKSFQISKWEKHLNFQDFGVVVPNPPFSSLFQVYFSLLLEVLTNSLSMTLEL